MSTTQLPRIKVANNSVSDLRTVNKTYSQKSTDFTMKQMDKVFKSTTIAATILSKDNNYYPKSLDDQKLIDEENEVFQNLKSLKKSHDELKLKILLKEKEIEKMKKEIDEMNKKDNGFNQDSTGNQQKTTNLADSYEDTKQKMEDAVLRHKALLHMQSRIQKDIIIYTKRANIQNLALTQLKTLNTLEESRYQKIIEEQKRLDLALEEIIQGIEEEEKNRENNIHKYKKDLEFQNNVEIQRDQRVRRQQEVAEGAANDLLINNIKKWKKLLQTHKFLNGFLKLKMEREIKHYSAVEKAYQKIKASTGIADAMQIVKKFLTRESTYSHLLISIAEYEKKIENFKTENDDLRSKLKVDDQLISNEDGEDISQFQKNFKSLQELEDVEKKLKETNQKSLQCEMLLEKQKEWINKNLLKFNKVSLISEQDMQSLMQQSVPERFAKLFEILHLSITDLQEDQIEALLKIQIKGKLNETSIIEFKQRNIRVQGKQLRRKQEDEQSSKHYSREDFDDFEEISEKSHGDVEEEENITSLRDDIKKGDLKKKK